MEQRKLTDQANTVADLAKVCVISSELWRNTPENYNQTAVFDEWNTYLLICLAYIMKYNAKMLDTIDILHFIFNFSGDPLRV